jgi:hypothetical protein
MTLTVTGLLLLALGLGLFAAARRGGPRADRGGVVVGGNNRGPIVTGTVGGHVTVGGAGTPPAAPTPPAALGWIWRGPWPACWGWSSPWLASGTEPRHGLLCFPLRSPR